MIISSFVSLIKALRAVPDWNLSFLVVPPDILRKIEAIRIDWLLLIPFWSKVSHWRNIWVLCLKMRGLVLCEDIPHHLRNTLSFLWVSSNDVLVTESCIDQVLILKPDIVLRGYNFFDRSDGPHWIHACLREWNTVFLWEGIKVFESIALSFILLKQLVLRNASIRLT